MNVEKQRGKGVWDQSVSALHILNKLGYGVPGTGLELHLVYNPVCLNKKAFYNGHKGRCIPSWRTTQIRTRL